VVVSPGPGPGSQGGSSGLTTVDGAGFTLPRISGGTAASRTVSTFS
jgi:hypothetical protein